MTLKNLSPNTLRSYYGWLERLFLHSGNPLDQAEPHAVVDYLHHLVTVEKLKGSTLNQAFCGIRLYLRDYRKLKGGQWDIWDQFKIRINKPLPHVLTQDEVQSLLSHVRKGRFRSVLTTMYLCGLRISEAVSLRPQNIIGKRRIIQILNSKGGKIVKFLSAMNSTKSFAITGNIIAILIGFSLPDLGAGVLLAAWEMP